MSLKARTLQQACRTYTNTPYSSNQLISQRQYATNTSNTNTKPLRRSITVTSDDGRYAWSELSKREKAARTTQQSFNFVFVTAGALATIAVSYLLYTELFAADSKTVQFNRAVERIKADPRCREILGPANKIRFHGDPSWSKWARSRPLAHTVEVDRMGTTHFKMHFYAEGVDDTRGTIAIHMTKKSDESELSYRLLSLSVPGYETVYLENTDAKSPAKGVMKMFGVQWR